LGRIGLDLGQEEDKVKILGDKGWVNPTEKRGRGKFRKALLKAKTAFLMGGFFKYVYKPFNVSSSSKYGKNL